MSDRLAMLTAEEVETLHTDSAHLYWSKTPGWVALKLFLNYLFKFWVVFCWVSLCLSKLYAFSKKGIMFLLCHQIFQTSVSWSTRSQGAQNREVTVMKKSWRHHVRLICIVIDSTDSSWTHRKPQNCRQALFSGWGEAYGPQHSVRGGGDVEIWLRKFICDTRDIGATD